MSLKKLFVLPHNATCSQDKTKITKIEMKSFKKLYLNKKLYLKFYFHYFKNNQGLQKHYSFFKTS
jgi:hypothetical protein